MQSLVFQDSGIVGKVGSEFVLEEVYKLGRSIAHYFVKDSDVVQTIVIARNHQNHSELIEQELAQAFIDSGLKVILLGISPITAMFFSLHTLPVQAGIMISDFDFGMNFAGIKIYYNKEQIDYSKIKTIQEFYQTKKWLRTDSLGDCKEYPKVQKYAEWLSNQFSDLRGFEQSCIIDAGFSSLSIILPQLIEKLNFKNTRLINTKLFQESKNLVMTSEIVTQKTVLIDAIKYNNSQIGISFSNDGDKVFFITSQSELVSNDKLNFLFSHDIANTLIEKNVELFASRTNGCFYFRDRYFGYEDGIYAMLRLLAILQKNGKTIDKMLENVERFSGIPEIKVGYAVDLNSNCSNSKETTLEENNNIKMAKYKKVIGTSKGDAL